MSAVFLADYDAKGVGSFWWGNIFPDDMGDGCERKPMLVYWLMLTFFFHMSFWHIFLKIVQHFSFMYFTKPVIFGRIFSFLVSKLEKPVKMWDQHFEVPHSEFLFRIQMTYMGKKIVQVKNIITWQWFVVQRIPWHIFFIED